MALFLLSGCFCIILLVLAGFYLVAAIAGLAGHNLSDNPLFIGLAFFVALMAGAGYLYWLSSIV